MIKDENAALSEMYSQVIEEGRKLILQKRGTSVVTLDDAEENKTQEISGVLLREYVDKIKEYCENFDGDEMIEVAREAAHYSYQQRTLKPYFDKMIEYVSDFEYDSARLEVDRMLQELGME